MKRLPIDFANRDARSVLDSIRRIVRSLRVSSRVAEKKVGLTGAQLFVLRHLAHGGRALSVNELAARTLTHQSSVSVVVQRLTRRGLIVNQRSRADGRRLELALTHAGRNVVRKAPGAAQDRLIRALHTMPPKKRRQLAALLVQLVRDTGITDELPSLFFEEDGPRGGEKHFTKGTA